MSEHNCQLSKRSALKVMQTHWMLQDTKGLQVTGYRTASHPSVPGDLLAAAKQRWAKGIRAGF